MSAVVLHERHQQRSLATKVLVKEWSRSPVIGVRGHPTYGSSGGGGCSEHHSLTCIKGPDEEKRKEQNTVLYECTRILLPELSIILTAIKIV